MRVVRPPEKQDGADPAHVPRCVAAYAVVQDLALPPDGPGRGREYDPQAVQLKLILQPPLLEGYCTTGSLCPGLRVGQLCHRHVMGGIQLLRPEHRAVLHAPAQGIGRVQVIPVELKQGAVIVLILGKDPVKVSQQPVRVQPVPLGQTQNIHGVQMAAPQITEVDAEWQVPGLVPVPAHIVPHLQHLHVRMGPHDPGQLLLIHPERLPGGALLPAHGPGVFLPGPYQVCNGLPIPRLGQHLDLPGVDGVGGEIGDQLVEFCRIAPGPTGPVLPPVKKSAVPKEGVALQCLPVEDGIGAVIVPGDGAGLKRLLDQLFPPQLAPLVGDAGVLVIPLMVHLHHLALDKPVAAGAPGDWARGQRRLIGVVLVQHQGVGIEGVSFGAEEHRQLRLPQGFPALGPGQVDGRHLPPTPGAGQPVLMP